MVLLSVDPGTRCAGYGVLKKDGRKTKLIDYGCWSMSGSKPMVERVTGFYGFFVSKVKEHGVTDLAIETPFLGKCVATYGKLSYLRGVLYLLAGQHGLKLYEFSPRVVKRSITGSGAASKEQVANLIVKYFPGIDKGGPLKDDITDALGVGLCALWGRRPPTIGRQSSFI